MGTAKNKNKSKNKLKSDPNPKYKLKSTGFSSSSTGSQSKTNKWKDISGIPHQVTASLREAAKNGYQPTKDKNVVSAKADYDNLVANKPGEFQSTYKGQLDNIYNQIMNRPNFSYDLSSDPMWQQYKDQYTALGKQAMADTMGAAAGLTGGYGSTYSQNVGQQAYNGYLTQLNEMIPELYGMALNKYQLEGDQLNTAFNAANTLYGNEYGEYRDKVADYNTDREFLYGVYSDQYDKGETAFNNRYSMLADIADIYNNDYYNKSNLSLSKKAQTLDEKQFKWDKKMDMLNYKLASKKASSSGSGSGRGRSKKSTYKGSGGTADSSEFSSIKKVCRSYKSNDKLYDYVQALIKSGKVSEAKGKELYHTYATANTTGKGTGDKGGYNKYTQDTYSWK